MRPRRRLSPRTKPLVRLVELAALVAIHFAALWAMDGLGLADQLLSPGGTQGSLALFAALAFVALRLVVIGLVPGLALFWALVLLWERLRSRSVTHAQAHGGPSVVGHADTGG